MQRAGHTVTLSPLTPPTFTQHSHILGVRESELKLRCHHVSHSPGRGPEAKGLSPGVRQGPLSGGGGGPRSQWGASCRAAGRQGWPLSTKGLVEINRWGGVEGHVLG